LEREKTNDKKTLMTRILAKKKPFPHLSDWETLPAANTIKPQNDVEESPDHIGKMGRKTVSQVLPEGAGKISPEMP
jgi:hypothetical protein